MVQLCLLCNVYLQKMVQVFLRCRRSLQPQLRNNHQKHLLSNIPQLRQIAVNKESSNEFK
ncbi:hypothetical protein B5S45_08540 [Morganella morganii]|nr:hypothetical protein MC49_011690 [Morganella morganii]OPL25226.1 hypothetical protein B5S45_08540 [Morganella morganii]